MKKNYKQLFILLIFPFFVFGQDLGKIGKSDLFKLTGGVSMNTVLYEGNSNRESFTYFLAGNVNLNISEVYNIPFSFSYSNSKFQTNNPFTFNRFSLHPSYKWVTAHIGDVNMSFSPYTLNGHQFTGLGIDLAPKDKFKISLMYGRLIKEREYDKANLNGEASYKRMGYGFKTSYQFEKAKVGFIFFKAKDEEESLKERVPIEQDIQPKENTVVSFDGDVKVNKELNLKGEIAFSALTEDTRIKGGGNGFASFLQNTNVTTQYYKAYNLNLIYRVFNGNIGVGYEYIDPNYKTLGGYFFNNDLENITVNAFQRVFKDKLAIAFNAGLQRDDLDGSKTSQLRRLVSSINMTLNASDKLNISTGYSNFQSYTNIKNQFDYINNVSEIEAEVGAELDKANVLQISQNANINVNYILKETESNRQNANFGFTYQNAVNRIAEIDRVLDKSNFYNGNFVYTIGYPQQNLNISGAINASYNEFGFDNNMIFGPTVSASKSYFEKKLKVNGSIGYNQSLSNGSKQGDITNLRIGARYVYLKRHNFTLNIASQFRNSLNKKRKDATITFGYNYSFGSFSSKDIRWRKSNKRNKKNKKVKEKSKDDIRFIYKDSIYKGAIAQIDKKLSEIIKSNQFKKVPKYKKEELEKYRREISDEENDKAYKIKAIQFLENLYKAKDYTKQFNNLLLVVLRDLSRDAVKLDYAMEQEYIKTKNVLVKHILWNKSAKDKLEYSNTEQNEYKELKSKEEKALSKLVTHRWIASEVKKFRVVLDVESDKHLLREFFKQEVRKVFKMFEKKNDKRKIKLYLLTELIKFYAKKSQKYIDLKKYELKYIYKTN